MEPAGTSRLPGPSPGLPCLASNDARCHLGPSANLCAPDHAIADPKHSGGLRPCCCAPECVPDPDAAWHFRPPPAKDAPPAPVALRFPVCPAPDYLESCVRCDS